MLIHVDTATGASTVIGQEDKSPMLKAYQRMGEEMEDWQKYKGMDAKAYKIPAMQEFQHVLIAASDFMNAMRDSLNAEEQEEFNIFRSKLL